MSWNDSHKRGRKISRSLSGQNHASGPSQYCVFEYLDVISNSKADFGVRNRVVIAGTQDHLRKFLSIGKKKKKESLTVLQSQKHSVELFPCVLTQKKQNDSTSKGQSVNSSLIQDFEQLQFRFQRTRAWLRVFDTAGKNFFDSNCLTDIKVEKRCFHPTSNGSIPFQCC